MAYLFINDYKADMYNYLYTIGYSTGGLTVLEQVYKSKLPDIG